MFTSLLLNHGGKVTEKTNKTDLRGIQTELSQESFGAEPIGRSCEKQSGLWHACYYLGLAGGPCISAVASSRST